jgi:polysaccharide export outer membrane protein
MDRIPAHSRRIALFCAVLLAVAPAQAQMVGGGVNGMAEAQAAQLAQQNGSNIVAMPAGGTTTSNSTVRPTINGQNDPYAVTAAQGAATGQYATPMGTSSMIPAAGLQTTPQTSQAYGTTPGVYGGAGEPVNAPTYSIQAQPLGGPYSQPQYSPYQPQYGQQPSAPPPAQPNQNMVAMSPAYNQIASPYAAARTPPPTYGTPYPAPYGAPYAPPPVMEGGYTLGPGDKIHLTVFGEPDLTNDYQLDGNGNIRLPLGGIVRAAGNTAQSLEAAIYYALVPNYMRNPRLTVDVLAYRPVYVVGQVQKPGQFAYVNDMTMMNAIGMAGGFTQQARESSVYVRHEGDPVEQEVPTNMPLLIRPGDTVRVDTTLFWDAMNMIAPVSGPVTLAAGVLH